MTNNSLLIVEISNCITKDFDLSNEDLQHPQELNEIRTKLKKIIEFLLNNDFQKLITIFYRLDIDENKVRNILSKESPDFLTEKLTDLIIEREIQKAETRLKYKNDL